MSVVDLVVLGFCRVSCFLDHDAYDDWVVMSSWWQNMWFEADNGGRLGFSLLGLSISVWICVFRFLGRSRKLCILERSFGLITPSVG